MQQQVRRSDRRERSYAGVWSLLVSVIDYWFLCSVWSLLVSVPDYWFICLVGRLLVSVPDYCLEVAGLCLLIPLLVFCWRQNSVFVEKVSQFNIL
ncbi:hypothetical protein EMCRGX_G032155 [Ephydatia muelleri]